MEARELWRIVVAEHEDVLSARWSIPVSRGDKQDVKTEAVWPTKLNDSATPSAALTVADSWASFSKIKKQRVAQAAFAYWKMCLSKAGYDPKGTVVVLRDAEGVDLVKVTANSDKTTVDFLK